MSKLRVAALIVAPALAGSASAQSDPRGACKADYDKYCAGVAPGGGRVVSCLTERYGQLSKLCKQALDSHKK